MRYYTENEVKRVLSRYNPEHDLGADCPVTWREERLATAIMEQQAEIEQIKAQIKAILESYPMAKNVMGE